MDRGRMARFPEARRPATAVQAPSSVGTAMSGFPWHSAGGGNRPGSANAKPRSPVPRNAPPPRSRQLPQGMIVRQAVLGARRIVRRRLQAGPRGGNARALAVGQLDPQRQTSVGAPVSPQNPRLLPVERVSGALDQYPLRLKLAEWISLIFALDWNRRYLCPVIRKKPQKMRTTVAKSLNWRFLL